MDPAFAQKALRLLCCVGKGRRLLGDGAVSWPSQSNGALPRRRLCWSISAAHLPAAAADTCQGRLHRHIHPLRRHFQASGLCAKCPWCALCCFLIAHDTSVKRVSWDGGRLSIWAHTGAPPALVLWCSLLCCAWDKGSLLQRSVGSAWHLPYTYSHSLSFLWNGINISCALEVPQLHGETAASRSHAGVLLEC